MFYSLLPTCCHNLRVGRLVLFVMKNKHKSVFRKWNFKGFFEADCKYFFLLQEPTWRRKFVVSFFFWLSFLAFAFWFKRIVTLEQILVHCWNCLRQSFVHEILGIFARHCLKVCEVWTLQRKFEDLGDLCRWFGLLRFGLAHDHSRFKHNYNIIRWMSL